ncbi:HNH endonuclease [Hyunsoonleella aestuarii]|uniref:HNH nuclease domain-containing protein n=1 Tax=Hyunsoonleella aestuarii TaxID=912802 RepID=A0ABP8EEA3_9FLAO|nr:HNH endonuclease [Hyunsoonleella aestuarii]
MSQSSFKKILSPSEVGAKKMNDRYLTFKSKVDYIKFYGKTSPVRINHIDKVSIEQYTFRYDNAVSNGEVRLYEMGLFYAERGALPGDEVKIEKKVIDGNTFYEIDLLRNGISTYYSQDYSLPDEVNEDNAKGYPEGYLKSVLVNKFERSIKARNECIDYYGAICAACEFDFEDKYGDIGKGFIHVHHLVPISEIGKSYKVDPINDLIPVCPNCHAMIHKRKPNPFRINDIKERLEK